MQPRSVLRVAAAAAAAAGGSTATVGAASAAASGGEPFADTLRVRSLCSETWSLTALSQHSAWSAGAAVESWQEFAQHA